MAPAKMMRTVSTRARVQTGGAAGAGGTAMGTAAKGKRKADASPTKQMAAKRSALGDMTNATRVRTATAGAGGLLGPHKVTAKMLPPAQVRTAVRQHHPQGENIAPPPAPGHKVLTRQSVKALPPLPNQTVQKPKEQVVTTATTTATASMAVASSSTQVKVKTRLSNEFEKTLDSLYASALDDTSISSRRSSTGSSSGSSTNGGTLTADSTEKMSVTLVAHQMEAQLNLGNHEVPDGIVDFDKENWDDVFQISHYAMDIFNYLKMREALFQPKDYIEGQAHLTRWMRSLLVDWMVEIQESFELNHETLYLGVKMVDLYLSRRAGVGKDVLQLVGAAAMFIASKYDERIPPLVDDFLYICDGAYTRRDLLRMEIDLLKVVDFDLGMPLSYRFLRRYARAAKLTMPILTLARFVLEHALMDYATMRISDSQLASAALFLALRMKAVSGWTPTLEFYTGYKLAEIIATACALNAGLARKPKEALMTVRNKYSHKIFFEVAKTPLLSNEELVA